MADDLITPLRHLQDLLGMSRRVSSEEDLQELLDTAAHAISQTLGFGAVVINVYRPAWDDLIAAAVESHHPGAREQLLGSTLHIDDLGPILDERFLYHGAYMARMSAEQLGGVTSYVPPIPSAEDWETWGPDDWLCVPMRDVNGSLVGLLSVDHPPGLRRPGPDAVRLLVSYTSCVTVAIETAQRSRAAARHQVGLEALLDISGRIARSSFGDLMQTVCAGVRDALGFERVAVQMIDASGILSWRAGVGFDLASMPEGRTLEDLAPLMDPSLEIEGCFFLTRDQALERIADDMVDYVSRNNGVGPHAWCHHWLFVPLSGADGVIRGFLWADDPVDRLVPSSQALKALRTFANSATIALESATQMQHLDYAAHHDPLTGLGNRALLAARACSVHQSVHALVLVDVDDFKAINDNYGHSAGDEVLVAVADRLRGLVRPGDITVRLGGDEFALLLPDCPISAAEDVAERVLGALKAPISVENAVLQVSASLGVAGGTDLDDLLRRADRAMYLVKHSRKGGWGSDTSAPLPEVS